MHEYPFRKSEPKPRTTHFIPIDNYRDPEHEHTIIRWGCECPECGAKHEFTRGWGWRFCPACGHDFEG